MLVKTAKYTVWMKQVVFPVIIETYNHKGWSKGPLTRIKTQLHLRLKIYLLSGPWRSHEVKIYRLGIQLYITLLSYNVVYKSTINFNCQAPRTINFSPKKFLYQFCGMKKVVIFLKLFFGWRLTRTCDPFWRSAGPRCVKMEQALFLTWRRSEYGLLGERSSLREMKACICPSGKLLCLWTYKTIETVYNGQSPNLFDNWADPSLHLLLQKSSMGNLLVKRLYLGMPILRKQRCQSGNHVSLEQSIK